MSSSGVPSLSDLAKADKKAAEVPTLSLGALAKDHLEGGKAAGGGGHNFQIPDLFGSAPSPSEDASQFHIPPVFGPAATSESEGAKKGGMQEFIIPDVFGEARVEIGEESSAPIDLMRALNLAEEEEEEKRRNLSAGGPTASGRRRRPREDDWQDNQVERAEFDFFRDLLPRLAGVVDDVKSGACACTCASASSFGRVVCRRWREEDGYPLRAKLRPPASASASASVRPPHGIAPFRFDVPSPDDVVLAAQGEALGRPRT